MMPRTGQPRATRDARIAPELRHLVDRPGERGGSVGAQDEQAIGGFAEWLSERSAATRNRLAAALFEDDVDAVSVDAHAADSREARPLNPVTRPVAWGLWQEKG